jgi:hypothetical protein
MPVIRQGVRSIAKSGSTGLTGAVTLSQGSNITLTQSGNDISIAASGGGGSSSWLAKTANYTAASGDKIICDSSGGIFTITLPASPSTGDNVTIKSGGSAATNNITVGRNSQTIMGLAENMTIQSPNIEVTFVFNGSDWRI